MMQAGRTASMHRMRQGCDQCDQCLHERHWFCVNEANTTATYGFPIRTLLAERRVCIQISIRA
jgi:D-arabinose 1-dehydrogenase-like Zn-dependent alcohol dehydrogenase